MSVILVVGAGIFAVDDFFPDFDGDLAQIAFIVEFAFADGDGSPVEKVSFAGLGAVNALRGAYGVRKSGLSLLLR